MSISAANRHSPDSGGPKCLTLLHGKYTHPLPKPVNTDPTSRNSSKPRILSSKLGSGTTSLLWNNLLSTSFDLTPVK